MKKFLFAILVLFVISIFAGWNNLRPINIISGLVNRSGINSGGLTYRIDLFGIMPVGEAEFSTETKEMYQGKKALHLRAVAKTRGMVLYFFRGEAVLDSYIDPLNYLPFFFRQKIATGVKPVIEKEITYDQGRGVMALSGVSRQIMPDTQDPLSAIFNIRKMDLDNIRRLEMNINTNQKNYILEGIVTAKEVLIYKKPYKLFVIKAEIRRRDGNPYHKSKVTMVLLKDKENIPVLIRVFASGVLINAKLTQIK